MLGTTTINKLSVSSSYKASFLGSPRYSKSWVEIQRPLMTPEECGRLPGAIKDKDGKIVEAGDMLIFSAGFAPIYGKQILYFKDPVFTERSQVSAPEGTDSVTERGNEAATKVVAGSEGEENEPKPVEPGLSHFIP